MFADEGRKRLGVPVIDMFGMVSQPDEVATTSKICQLKPRLIRDCKQQFTRAKRDQALKRLLGLKQMFEHFQRHHHVIAALIKCAVEQVCASEALFGPTASCGCQRILTKVEPFIALQRYAALRQLVENESLPTPEIENGAGCDLTNGLRDQVVEATEAQPVDRVLVGVLCDVALGCVVPDCCCVHADWTSFIIVAASRSLRESSGVIWPSSKFVTLRMV